MSLREEPLTGSARRRTFHLTHLVCYVVHHDGGLGASVVHGGQTVVALLTSCVPNFKLDRCIVQAYRLSQEGSCVDTKQREQCQLSLEPLILWSKRLILETHIISCLVNRDKRVLKHQNTLIQLCDASAANACLFRSVLFTFSQFNTQLQHHHYVTSQYLGWSLSTNSSVID